MRVFDILVVAEKEFVSKWEDEDSTSGYQPYWYEAEITAPRAPTLKSQHQNVLSCMIAWTEASMEAVLEQFWITRKNHLPVELIQ